MEKYQAWIMAAIFCFILGRLPTRNLFESLINLLAVLGGMACLFQAMSMVQSFTFFGWKVTFLF